MMHTVLLQCAQLHILSNHLGMTCTVLLQHTQLRVLSNHLGMTFAVLLKRARLHVLSNHLGMMLTVLLQWARLHILSNRFIGMTHTVLLHCPISIGTGNHTVFLIQFGINLHMSAFQKAEIA